MSKLQVYRNKAPIPGVPVGSLQLGIVFEWDGFLFIKSTLPYSRLAHTGLNPIELENMGVPIYCLSTFGLEFLDEDHLVVPVKTAQVNIT